MFGPMGVKFHSRAYNAQVLMVSSWSIEQWLDIDFLRHLINALKPLVMPQICSGPELVSPGNSLE